MKITFVSTVLCLAALFTNTVAQFSVDDFPDIVYVGDYYTVSWSAVANYSYNIWLVERNPGNPYTWTNGTSLGSALHFPTLNPSYTWTVPLHLNSSVYYRLWIDAFPSNGAAANLHNTTNYFAILQVPPANSTNTTATQSGTASATASATSGVTSSSSTSAPSSGDSSGGHSSISGGAIAGIVIGCLIALALLAGAYILMKWRKKKTALAQREAAARAGRLEPVMQTQSGSYEMHGRSPQVNKETNV